MESLKSQSEQCIFIFTTKIENSSQLKYLPESICNFLFERKSFPILLPHEVKSIPKIANAEGSIYKVLQKISFSINYDRFFLENEILLKPNLIQQSKDYISMLILHFYLSFFRTYNHDTDDIVTILKSLLLILQNKSNNNEKYQIYAISGFTTIILDKQFQINYSDQQFLSCISDFFVLPTIPQESLNVLQYMLEKIGNGTDNEEELSNVLQIINYAFQKYRPLFSKQFISTIFLNLRFQLVNLNYVVIAFLNQFSDNVNDQDVEMYIKAFPAALIPYYEKSLKKLNDEQMREKINFYDTYTAQNPQSIKITLPLSFKENPPLLDFNKFDIKSIHCRVFTDIISIVKSKDKKFCNIFVEQMLKTIQIPNLIQYFELFAINLHFLIQLSPLSPELLETSKFLFESPYFQNPIFCEDEANSEPTYYLDPKVSSIRLLIVNFLFRQEFSFIQTILQNVTQHVLIFPEFCYRCIYIDEKYKNPKLSSLFFEIYSIQIHNNSEEGKSACLITLKNYINTPQLRMTFFDNSELYKYVFSFININPERREFMLDFITKYFFTCRNMLSYKFIENLNRIFMNVCDVCTTNVIDENLNFILDLIIFCTKIMQINNGLIEYFESFFDKICFLLTKLPQNNPLSKLIFTHSFALFSVHHITQNESNAIETSAISLFGLTPNLKKLIISLMGAENENLDEFIIKQPKAILLLIKLFKDDLTIWSFLSHLCQYSPVNSIYCHEAGVDSIILDQLLQMKVANDLKYEKLQPENQNPKEESKENKNKNELENNENENKEEKESSQKEEDKENENKHKNSEIENENENKLKINENNGEIVGDVDHDKIKDLLNLLYEISKYSSSINIVNHYMSLLCSDPENSRVSDYHMMFVKLIHNLARETHKIPMTALYEPQNFENIGIVFDWTVCTWLFITEGCNCPIITATKDDFCYEVSIKSQVLYLNINKSKTEYQFDCTLPLNDWVCITLKVEPQSTTLFINDEKKSTVTHQSFFINFANFSFNSSRSILLGAITIYNSIIKESLFKKGPRRIWKDPENTLSLAVRPHVHNNQIETEIYISKKTKIHKEFKKAFPTMNFIDILCERCGVTLILPLLAQVTMVNADNDLLYETLSIIHNLLLYRTNSQKKFREMSGIRIISHLITNCYTNELNNKELLNYKIYSKLYEIYTTLEDKKSRQKFVKYILVNLMIWVHTKPEDVVKIMNFLADQDKKTFWKYYKLNYSLTIAAFRVYFSHNDYHNIPRFKGTEEEMYQVRKDLIIFSRNFCDEIILNSDFLIVISHLKYSADMSKETDLLKFLEEIINKDYQNTKNIKAESKMMICYLMRKCTKTVVDSTKPNPNRPPHPINHFIRPTVKYNILCDFNLLIEVIKLFYNSLNVYFVDDIDHLTIELNNNLGSRYVQQKDLIYFLMRFVSDSFIDSALLNLLIPLINTDYPLLFSFAAMISVSLGEQYFYSFMQQIKLNPKVPKIDHLWPLWIVIGILEFSSKNAEEVNESCSSSSTTTTTTRSNENISEEEEEQIIDGIEFLLDNSPVNQWEDIFIMIVNFSLYKRYCRSKAKILFLRGLSKRIDNEEKCELFIKLSIHQIFLRKYEMKLRRNQSKSAAYNICFDTDDENENAKSTFVGDIDSANFNLPRSSIDIQKSGDIEDHQFSRRLSNFTSKDSYSRFVSPVVSKIDHESHVESIDPKKNKKISMKTLDNLLDIIHKNIADYKCIQEIKSNVKDDKKAFKWFDLSLANRIVDMFLTFPSSNYIDDVIIVEAYRLKCSSEEDKVLNKYVISAIEQENLSERYSISYFNKICKKFNIESPFKQKIIESHLINEYRNRKSHLLNCMKNGYDMISKPTKNVKKIFKYYTDELAESTQITFKQTIQDYLASVGLRMTKSKNKWSHLCASMMQGPETPWHRSIKQDKIHYRRDFSSCFCFCPFKLKVNKKYDQHLIASFKRNTGSQKTAEELYEEFLKKIKNKESRNFYYDDLQDSETIEIVEDHPKIDTDVSQYIFTADCQIIKVSKETDACFMLGKDCIVIQTESKVKKYPLYSIKEILLRDYLHRPTAIEIFLHSGVTVFLNFNEITNNIVTDQIQFQVIRSSDNFAEVQQCTSNEKYFKSKKITQMWCENKISNFEYLVLLNIYSGRSFNNASQYPFLPWIVFDYESKKISPAALRQLSEPIGAVNKERLYKLLVNYKEKKDCGLTPFLYSSGPMCPLALYYWLVRVEPFTTFHIEMQGGSFDHSDRVFASWSKAKHLITTMEDMYRELPPEAFFSHCFLVNYNEISLGIDNNNNNSKEKNNSNSVENFDPFSQNVELPPWADNPLDFIYKNRKVLESEIVSRNLNKWIDLIWGYKQNGPEAEKALNIYRPEMYHNIWQTDEGKDENNRPIIETYLSQVGQIPVQLFTSPHPTKSVIIESKMTAKINELKSVNENNKEALNDSNEPSSAQLQNNQKQVQPIKFRINEITSFIGAQIVTKRKSSNEAQNSFNYLLMKNEINIYGLNEDGEITIIKIGYKLNDVPEIVLIPPKHKKFSLTKGLRSKDKNENNNSRKSLSSITTPVDINNVSYSNDVIKKHYNLTSDGKKKKSSSLTKKYEVKFTFLDESKICYSDNARNILLLDDLKRNVETEMLMNQNKITALAFDGDLTVAAVDSDGFLSILQIFRSTLSDDSIKNAFEESFSLEVLYTTPSFYERIRCCDISKDFHQVVCGSTDGYILIFSLSNQTFLRTIKLDEGKKPQSIMITKSWGFIFSVLTEISGAKKKTYLAVWTINGDFIKMKEIEQEITKITTWRSKSGFDYFLFSTPKYDIIAGEVFTLETFFTSKVSDEVISLGYDYDLENAIVLSKDGIAWFIPCVVPPPEF